jgi:hypothetical protein
MWRARGLRLVSLANRCPRPGSRCAVRRIVSCKLLKTDPIFTLCSCSLSPLLPVSPSMSPITRSSASKTSIRLVPRYLQQVLHSSTCLHTAAVPTRPSSERDTSVHYIQTPAPTFASFSLAQHCAALSAVLLSSSIIVVTSGSSPGAGQLMPSVVRPCSCSVSTTRHIGVQDKRSSCSSLGLLLHAFASLAANCCCLASKITYPGVSPDYRINAPLWVVGSAPRTDLACRLMRRWRSSRLPTSLGSHQSWLPYSATALTQATWTVHTLSATTPYVFVRAGSLAFAALAFFMHRM